MTTLTENELAILASMRTHTSAGEYWKIYEWLADLLESKGVSTTDSSVLWLRGATEANAGRGAFSALIRTYSETQSLLRYGNSQVSLMQAASDSVALNLLKDLLGCEAAFKEHLLRSQQWTRAWARTPVRLRNYFVEAGRGYREITGPGYYRYFVSSVWRPPM